MATNRDPIFKRPGPWPKVERVVRSATQCGSLAAGDVVQINPQAEDALVLAVGCVGGLFMIVDKIESWGAGGYVMTPHIGAIYVNFDYKDMVRIGVAEWHVTT